MKTYEIILKPTSAFSTTMKGDTLFGQFCWQLVYDKSLLKHDFEKAINFYTKKPFIVFSSAFPILMKNDKKILYLPKPEFPWFKTLGETSRLEGIQINKKLKKKNRLICYDINNLSLDKDNLISDEEILSDSPELFSQDIRTRNKINRFSFTTTGNGFDPYISEVFYFNNNFKLCIICTADNEFIDNEQIHKALKNIGKSGFGKDASMGMGHFETESIEEIKVRKPEKDDLFLTLAPCVPEKSSFEKIYYKPFTRFGRHGDILARSQNPFKRPVIMADESAVLKQKNNSLLEKSYTGTGIKGASYIEPNTVVQGYAPILPIKPGA